MVETGLAPTNDARRAGHEGGAATLPIAREPDGGARVGASLAASPLEEAFSFCKLASLANKNWRSQGESNPCFSLERAAS
jgi:hypothetical protein